MHRKIHLDAPDIGDEEKSYLSDAIDANYVSTIGPFVPKFEKRFAGYLNVKGSVSTQSGTAAIHVALRELGIGQGDEVIVPSLTFIATVNPVIYTGATPVFADVDIDTWNISPEEIRQRITKRTKAIIPVHLYGNPCDMGEIMNIAQENNIYVIEDATESLGSRYKGKYTGTLGSFGCFSFNGNKIITTGGGGMVVAKDTSKIEHVKFLVNQARDNLNEYHHSEIGFNYRMTNLEAAMGLAQIEKLDGFLDKKRIFNKIYRDELNEIGSITFQQVYPGCESSYWFTCIMFKECIDIDKLQNSMKGKGISTRRTFIPIPELSPYRIYKKSNYENSKYIHERGLCLPGSTLNSEDDIYWACETIKSLI